MTRSTDEKEKAQQPVAWAIVEPSTNIVISAFPDEQAAISARPSMDHDTIPLYAAPSATRASDDWNELFKAVTMGGMDDEFRRIANIPALWPNPWNQDTAAVAFAVHSMKRRTDWLADLLKNCPHAEIIYNEDADADEPVGYTIRVESCSRMVVTAPTLDACIDLAMTTAPDEDNNIIAPSDSDAKGQG